MSPPQPDPRRPVRIIPVLDVKDGQVVRAVAGRRELYAPIRSRLTDSTDPRAVAEALLAAAGVNEFYVADLDALERHRPRLGWIAGLVADRGCRVLIEAGLRTAADARAVFDAGASAVVAGTETLCGVGELQALCDTYGPDRVILSLDLRNGRVVGDEAVWGNEPDPVAVVGKAVEACARRVIVLELARVGTGIGPGTTVLCRQLREAFPGIEMIAGGGVRAWADVDLLAAAGADGVLVASALHDGTLVAPRPS
jgi:phosphoribosylformimino-5-aminoimidazole carboxamide ribotide isomerase